MDDIPEASEGRSGTSAASRRFRKKRDNTIGCILEIESSVCGKANRCYHDVRGHKAAGHCRIL